MRQDTEIGGSNSKFPATRWSAIQAAKSDNLPEKRHAFEVIVAAYWKPVYKLIRIKWKKSNEDAKDLTQGFFAKAIEKNYFQKYDPGKARFRTFLRTCLDGFIANEEKAANRIKRGGGVQTLSLDFDKAENELKFSQLADTESIEDYFDKEWQRSLFSLAIEELRQACQAQDKAVYFDIFARYDLNESKLNYQDLAAEFKIPVTKVTNYLAHTRRELRRILLEKLREVTATEDEFRHEARSLLGIDLK